MKAREWFYGPAGFGSTRGSFHSSLARSSDRTVCESAGAALLSANPQPVPAFSLSHFEPRTGKHSGTEIADLAALVDRVIPPAGYAPAGSDAEGDRLMEELIYRAAANPTWFLAEVKAWLSTPNYSQRYPQSRANDSGDEAAWCRVHSIQSCIFDGQDLECYFCGQLQGEHAYISEVCPDGFGLSLDQQTCFRPTCFEYGPEIAELRRCSRALPPPEEER